VACQHTEQGGFALSDAVNFDSVFCQLIDYGLAVIRSDIVIGVRRRCRVKDGGLEKRGWFHLFEVPCQSGSGTLIVGSYGAFWAAESYVQKIRVEKDQLGTLSKEQREALRLRLAEDARRRAADEKRRHDKAAAEATIVWRKCRATGSSAYLDRKCVKP
jgi:putative DNA primase/helicase